MSILQQVYNEMVSDKESLETAIIQGEAAEYLLYRGMVAQRNALQKYINRVEELTQVEDSKHE